jgi:hypothetical protein
VPDEPRRTDVEIRGEIATERAQLVTAIDDLRAGVESKKKVAGVVAGAVAAAMTAATVATIVRRLRR